MTGIVLIILAVLALLSLGSGKIPQTGRYSDAHGEVIEAIITNTNKYADKAAVLRAQKDGRKFKVKLKPTEAHLWIKGDSINITLSDDGKYRVMFNDYFHQNEQRLRKVALEKLGKIKLHFFSARFTEYKKEHFELIKNSDMDSQRIFSFVTYMKMIDIYTPVAAALAVIAFIWKNTMNPDWKQLAVVVALILFVLWTLYSMTKMCKSILKKVRAQN